MAKHYILTAIAACLWSIFLAYLGGAYPVLRGGTIIICLLGVATCLLSGLFLETSSQNENVYFVTASERIVSALLPGVLMAIVVILIGGLGLWIALR